MNISRRRLLSGLGAAGVSGLLAQAMTGMIPAQAAPTWSGRQQLQPGTGNGKSVLILGAGIAGLTTAFELSRAGYEVTVLEAQNRAGGRNFTARRGDIVTENGPAGPVTQTCRFDEGLYLNLGPGRLPYHHRRMLRYCHELGVALEVYVMETTVNLYQTGLAFAGVPNQNRRVANDTRGWIAELLSAAIDTGLAGVPDRAAALSMLQVFGDLNASGAYAGSQRSGCAGPLGIAETCEPNPPLALTDLLASRFWEHQFYQSSELMWQATLFQPIGGMDMIVKAFVKQIGNRIRYGAVVTGLELADDNVEVTWEEGGRAYTRRADYCLSNIPMPILNTIPANFSPTFAEAVAFLQFEPSCKVGWQANSRFWESDKYQIYGGISYTDHNITQFWYPSYDYFTPKGTMTGAYNYTGDAIAMGNLSPADRLTLAKQGGALLHPEMNDESIVPTALGMSIAWQHVPFQGGAWAAWVDDAENRLMYQRLLAPDRRFHVIGDQVSPYVGWQEGAMISAEHVINQVAGLTPPTESTVAHAPDTASLTRSEVRVRVAR